MSYDDDVLATAPLAFWPSDDGSGSTVVDVSGNGFDMAPGPDSEPWPVWISDDTWGSVLDFGQYGCSALPPDDAPTVAVTFEADLSSHPVDVDVDEWTMAGWTRQQPGNIGGICGADFPDGVFFFNLAWLNTFEIANLSANRPVWNGSDFYYATGSNWNRTASTLMAPALPDDVSWQHFLVVNRSARMEIWQNGVLLTTDATAQTPQTSPAIGFRASGFGAFARMAIWDRAISEAEIAVLATPPSPVLPPVLNTWDDFNRADGPLGTATPSAFEWEA